MDSATGRDRKEKAAAGRAADVSFVLGELAGAHPAWPGAALIDPSAMAMASHVLLPRRLRIRGRHRA